MKNYINRRHIANVLNYKVGFNKPIKVNPVQFRFFECIEENEKLRFSPCQINIEKHMNKCF